MAATEIATKSITSISGCKLYKLDELTDGDTLAVPFGKVWAVFIQVIEATTPQYVSYTVSGSTITFECSGTTDADVMVFGE
ncbi:MAG TPA: hypothetical protein ENH95_05960 [Nitrosopumilus sp.]|nr:hypothetical protein [Nitrosopumilus sp.]